MLETDCIVPTAFVPIEQPETYKLYGVEHAVDVLRKQGMKKWQICKALRIGDDAWRDAIFEIRKKECIETMGVRGWMTPDEKKRIVMLRNAGAKLHEIAAETGRSMSAVKRVIEQDKKMTAQERTECAQSASAAAVMIMPQTVPDAVTEAVCARIDALTAGISDRLTQIKRMQQEVETYRSQIAELEAWMKEVNKSESHQTDYPSAAD